MEGRVCPRCGYERKQKELAPENECPGCGIIYDKYVSRQPAEPSRREQIPEVSDLPLGYAPPKRSSWSTLLAAVAALMMVALLAGGAYVTYNRYWRDNTKGTTKKAASFAYDIRGTWRGRMTTEVRTGSNRNMTLVYKMKVVVGPEYQVDGLTFTDIHARRLVESPKLRTDKPEVSCEISWIRPDEAKMSCDCLEFSGNYTYPYLRLNRSYRWLSLYYKHEFGGEIKFEADEVLSESQGDKMDQNGYFKYERSTKSLKSSVDVQLTPDMDFTLYQDAMQTFRLPARRLNNTLRDQRPDNVQRLFFNTYALPKFQGMIIEPPGGPNIRLDVEDPTQNATFEREPYGRPPFFYLSNLNDAVEFQCRIEKKHRKVEIQFYPDGRKTARVLDRFASPGDAPLVFQLKKD